jgi:TPR repeat protein
MRKFLLFFLIHICFFQIVWSNECLCHKNFKNSNDNFQLSMCLINNSSYCPESANATVLILKAAQENLPEAQYMASQIYFIGIPPYKRDLKLSAAWIAKAALNKHLLSMTRLGEFYLNGIGVQRNKTLAIEWLSVAAHAGDAKAKRILDKLKKEH